MKSLKKATLTVLVLWKCNLKFNWNWRYWIANYLLLTKAWKHFIKHKLSLKSLFFSPHSNKIETFLKKKAKILGIPLNLGKLTKDLFEWFLIKKKNCCLKYCLKIRKMCCVLFLVFFFLFRAYTVWAKTHWDLYYFSLIVMEWFRYKIDIELFDISLNTTTSGILLRSLDFMVHLKTYEITLQAHYYVLGNFSNCFLGT